MGILDEAIKEHLELKRQHGAGESELKKLEDEAFGAAERPGDEEAAGDALSEAPTAFMAQPGASEGDAGEAAVEDSSGKRRPAPQVADLQEAPEPEPAVEPGQADSHSTEEREAISEQPTEMYDVEEELAAEEREAPSEEALVEEEMGEPRLAPVDTLAGVGEVEVDAAEVEVTDAREEADELDDEFWDEKRLSDELDQALEAPLEAETAAEAEIPEEEADAEEPAPPAADHEDVLEDTPDFLEEAPEDDQLWFEQKPPKDFDLDD